MMDESIHVFLSRSLFVGLLPTLFIVASSIFAFRWYRCLIPVVVGLALYVVACLIRFTPVSIPTGMDIAIFVVGLPVLLGLAGCIWSVVAPDRTIERVYGLAISILGFGLSAGILAVFIQISWATI